MDLRITVEGEESLVDTFDFFLKLSCFFHFCKVTKVISSKKGSQMEYSFEQNPKERLIRQQRNHIQIKMESEEEHLHLADVAMVQLPDGQVVIHGVMNYDLIKNNEGSRNPVKPV